MQSCGLALPSIANECLWCCPVLLEIQADDSMPLKGGNYMCLGVYCPVFLFLLFWVTRQPVVLFKQDTFLSCRTPRAGRLL